MRTPSLIVIFLSLPLGVALGQGTSLHRTSPSAKVGTVQTDVPIISGRAIGGVAVDQAGRIYVSNFRKKVYRIARDGTVTTLTTDFIKASGNTIDENGELLQSEYDLNELYRIHEDGSRTLITSTGLSGPVGVAMHHGSIFVVNYLGDTISRIAPDGTTSLFSADPLLNGPNGLVFNGAGDMYVANLKDNHLLHVDMAGQARVVAAIGQQGAFNNAHVVAIGRKLYVSKIFKHKIFEVDPAGHVELVAGTGSPGIEDGFAPNEATLYHPNGMATGPGGIIYTNNYIGIMGTPGSRMTIRAIQLW